MNRKIEHIKRLIDNNAYHDCMGFIIVNKEDISKLSYNDKIFICAEGSLSSLTMSQMLFNKYIINNHPLKYRKINGPNIHSNDLMLIFLCENKRITY